MIKAVISDFGNVICKFDNGVFLKKISKYTDKSILELYYLIYTNSELPVLFETGKISSDEFYSGIVELCSLDISKEAFIEAFTNIFTPIESTMDLLERLSKKYKIALLSDTSEWDFEYGIKKTRVFPLFSEVTVSFEVGVLKPNKAMYEDILKKLNLQPEECVFIDDKKPYSDMATKLGIHGINYVSHKELLISLQKIGVEL